MQKITPFLWYDGKAEEAANLYVSVFKNAKILEGRRWGPGAPAPQGSILSMTVQIEGQEFILFNGGPKYPFTPAISLFVRCQTQAEVDELWSKLSAGGKQIQCGWLVDRFGVSWQIIPDQLGQMMQDKDPEKSRRVVQAMMKMVKIDIAGLERAYDGA